MNFDIKDFEKNIEKYKQTSDEIIEDQSGMLRVISHVLDFDPIDTIDFDRFTIKDARLAFQAMEHINETDIDDEYFFVNKNNPFIIYTRLMNTIFYLSESKNKTYKSEDNEIFI